MMVLTDNQKVDWERFFFILYQTVSNSVIHIRFISSCSTDSCNLLRTLGFSILGAAGGLKLWHTFRNSEGRQKLREDQMAFWSKRRNKLAKEEGFRGA